MDFGFRPVTFTFAVSAKTEIEASMSCERELPAEKARKMLMKSEPKKASPAFDIVLKWELN